ncbi:stimulator of interferon genes protein isoform X3 [Hyposmocoma kahamanoa]|uniref:stimulator of interferon genes protein isoform X3 n=1 Tax=Hyposmocoma kahamanoa TaxID=1477025 RepID=UPI000E6D6FE1|nr:stimulator of interferon genes protein isoform X3 [Hyposmocoma kahamanoa]
MQSRYLVYLIVIRMFQELYSLPQLLRSQRFDWLSLVKDNKNTLVMLAASFAVLWVTQTEKLISVEEFTCLFVAFLICQYFLKERKSRTINYGVGMACSYFEGYLKLIIPNDGTQSGGGFEHKIQQYEASQGVVFPVRMLLLVITKSLFCPPDMNHFNNRNRPDLPYMEAMSRRVRRQSVPGPQPLTDVLRDVAGVKNRQYRNSPYKIYRRGRLPVCVIVEFATPLHTLYQVLHNRDLYDELCDVDQAELMRDFCTQLQSTIERSPDTRGRCTLIDFDDTDVNANLASVILDKIAELEPNFEEILKLHENNCSFDVLEL